jgi:hypothetical protein
VAPPPNLPAAFLQHAAADPEEPWLFRAEGWDWVWHPWRELAGWLTGWTETLSDVPPGTRAAFLYDARPESVILDLAVQAAGLAPAPNGGREEGVWIERRGLEIEPSPSPPFPPPSGWTGAGIAAAGERLRGEIGEPGTREIVVLGGPLEDPIERMMMAWATLAGVAVVLEPDPALRIATAAWVRPTVFHGTPGEIAELRARLGKSRKGRLPFRRLRTLLVAGVLPEGEEAFWRERGVGVRTLPDAFAAERQHRGI